jgi:DegV family protein with EDD domain
LNKFSLATDSCCDIPKQELEQKGILCVGLSYIIDGVARRSIFSEEKEFRDYIALLRSGVMPSTAMLNSFDLETLFTEALEKNGGDLIFISLSSGISGSYNNAVSVAKELMNGKFKGRKIYVVDSKSGAAGQRAIAYIAAGLRDSGAETADAFARLNRLADCQQIYMLIDDLKHLKRGGRISALSAMVGSILNLKPLLVVNNHGQIKMHTKCRGMKKAISTAAALAKENYKAAADFKGDLDKVVFYISHADNDAGAEELCEAIREQIPGAEFKVYSAGPVIGTHTGPGALGLFFFGKPRLKMIPFEGIVSKVMTKN